jgi:hypothetical protein
MHVRDTQKGFILTDGRAFNTGRVASETTGLP